MTWRNWFMKGFFVAAKFHDIHSGNSTSASFQWNIFLKIFCDSGNVIRSSLNLKNISILLQQTCESIENIGKYVL